MNKGNIKMREKIEVEISDLIIGKKYYRFNYKIWRNGEWACTGNYSNSHSRSRNYMVKIFAEGYGVDQVLQQNI